MGKNIRVKEKVMEYEEVTVKLRELYEGVLNGKIPHGTYVSDMGREVEITSDKWVKIKDSISPMDTFLVSRRYSYEIDETYDGKFCVVYTDENGEPLTSIVEDSILSIEDTYGDNILTVMYVNSKGEIRETVYKKYP